MSVGLNICHNQSVTFISVNWVIQTMLIHLEPSNFICFPVSFATMSEAMTIPMTSDQIFLKLRETLKLNKLC